MVLPFKCSNRCTISFDHLRLSFQAVNTVFICKMCIKYQYASPEVCACTHVFWKRQGCALIGACALIRTNTVCMSVCLSVWPPVFLSACMSACMYVYLSLHLSNYSSRKHVRVMYTHLEPHFYIIAKLGYAGVYLIFLFLLQT